MLNEQKLKQIQSMVKTATVLSEQEKIEWLALIELMNDKQVTELEEILQKPKPVEVTLPASKIQSSSLSHISNLPSVLSDRKPSGEAILKPVPSPAPTPVKPAPTPISAPTPIPMPAATSRTASVPMPTIDTFRPNPEPVPMPPVNPILDTPTVSEIPPLPPPSMDLTSFEDISKLTSTALHNQNREAFHKTINDLAGQYGYFQVVTAFEQSPLYKDYLDYGKGVLSGKKEGLLLSQEEFEFVTDILLSLKVNRF